MLHRTAPLAQSNVAAADCKQPAPKPTPALPAPLMPPIALSRVPAEDWPWVYIQGSLWLCTMGSKAVSGPGSAPPSPSSPLFPSTLSPTCFCTCYCDPALIQASPKARPFLPSSYQYSASSPSHLPQISEHTMSQVAPTSAAQRIQGFFPPSNIKMIFIKFAL